MNKTNGKRQTANVKSDTQADMRFQERLEGYSKKALTYLVDQLTCQDRVNRGWMLKYLEDIDDMMPAGQARHLRDSIFEAIDNERLARDAQMGPVQMRPRTIEQWAYSLRNQSCKAYEKAVYGQHKAALKALLTLATEAVEALEDRIDAAAEDGKDALAEAMMEVTQTANVRGETADGNPPTALHQGGAKNKKADPVAAGPAESESSE